MYPHVARVAQGWDSVTSALGRVFAVDEPLTTTTVVVKTVTAGQTQTRATTTARTLITADATTRTTTVRAANASRPPRPQEANAFETSTLPTAFIPKETERVSDTTLALAPSTTRAVSTAPATTEDAFADQVTTASGTRGSATTQAQVDTQRDNNNVMTAGIVIGVLAGVLCVFVLAWFFFNRRRKQIENRRMAVEDEKINGPINPFADSAAIRTPTNAPRLSLRPVTQFLPTFPDRRVSRGANMMLSAEPKGQNSPLHKPAGASAWERPTVNSTSNDAWGRPGTAMSATPSNPFGDNQRIMEEPEREAARPVSPPTPPQKNVGLAATPRYSPEPVSPVDGSRQEFPTGAAVAAGAVAGVAATGAAAGLVRKASIRKDLPRPLDLTMPMPPAMSGAPAPPSPAGTEFSMHSVAPGQPIGPSSSAAAIAAAGGPPQSTVHRVTLDFKPTLDDEMGLTAGQLIRLLHEYDDGWALCIRLDRSQQGVVPRTCLSTRPVKPRPPPGGPRGPPVNPSRPGYPPHPNMGPRNGPPPSGPHGRPQSPYGRPGSAQSSHGRPMSPYDHRPNSPGGRMSPGLGQRSQSPGPRYQQQGRPQSPSGMSNRRMSPSGPSNMSRGPVPGQAY
ncbi:variant SH3 domain-containing protein [Podospora aff. communis PSN243]|uniref:Variant SH3 domain-containing protein n=1 Tax=Podospora aff. communis PSN243 TaxID=3040156 RepID=A0AAV9G8G0_9PEZI|nr:variant SH3 domain-containing protein [Podospora aff. communis PSN243]